MAHIRSTQRQANAVRPGTTRDVRSIGFDPIRDPRQDPTKPTAPSQVFPGHEGLGSVGDRNSTRLNARPR
jgi:hypothetical protein